MNLVATACLGGFTAGLFLKFFVVTLTRVMWDTRTNRRGV